MNVAIVGSNRGIGLALVEEILKKKHNVYAFCRQSTSHLNDSQPTQIIEGFDVTDFSSMQSQLDGANLPKMDWLIHVAGIMQTSELDQLNPNGIMKQLQVNALAPLMTVRAFLPHLSQQCKIGLVTSRMGSIADNTSGGYYGYRMSKAALNAAGKSLSMDLKEQGKSVFLLHPGYVKTDMTGHTGQVTANESALGLIKIMDSKKLDETGTFWHMNGEQLPW